MIQYPRHQHRSKLIAQGHHNRWRRTGRKIGGEVGVAVVAIMLPGSYACAKSKAHDDHLLAQDDVYATASIIVTAFFSTGIAECNSITSQLEMDSALILLLLPFTALSCNVLPFAKLTESIHNAAGDSLEWYQGPSHAGKLGVPWPTACLVLSKA